MNSFSFGFQTLIKNFSLCSLLMLLRTCHERFRVPDCLGVPYAGPYVFHLAFPQKRKKENRCVQVLILLLIILVYLYSLIIVRVIWEFQDFPKNAFNGVSNRSHLPTVN